MVMPDWTSRPAPENPTESLADAPGNPAAQNLARPLDRLAAVIVDIFVVLAPIYILLSAPFKKTMTLSFLMGVESEFFVTVFGMSGIAIFLIVIYQTLMHHFFRATLGKLLFDLRVVPAFENQSVSAWDQFLRAWVFVFEALLVGLPFLSVFSNGQRRPWHDRMSDTVVVTRARARAVGAPARFEQGMVRAFFVIFICFGLLGVLSQLRGLAPKVRAEEAVTALLERDEGACEVVTKNLSEEPSDREHERLEMAMTLYAAGLADRSCLESEVEREVASQTAVGPITYLAQAFVYADDADISNSYLDEVCETAPGSVECAMSSVVGRWSDEDWEGVEEALARAPRGSGYLEVWGVRHFMKQARYDRALSLLNRLIDRKYLAEFSLVQRVKGLFNSFRQSEAEAALMQAVSTLPETESQELSSWVCVQELQQGCAALESNACRQVEKLDDKKSDIDFELSSDALARVLARECKGEGEIDYLSYSEMPNDESWQTFFRANLKRQKRDRSASAHLFSRLLLSPDTPDILKVESARRWAQFADQAQLQDLFEQWRVLDSKETWVKTGNILFQRLAELKDQRLALKVARHLIKSEALSPQAMATLSRMVEDPKVGPQLRSPANVDEEEE